MVDKETTTVDILFDPENSSFESNVDYTTFLDHFQGPLDFLLYLINKAKIEIRDIFVSQVTEQFLSHMQGLEELDVNKMAEYLNIAATILKIKAQALVPNLQQDPELEAEIQAEKELLFQALEEYKKIKEEAVKLKELETIGYFFKEPDKNVGEIKTVFSLDNLTLDGLLSAFSALLIKRENAAASKEVREIPRDEYTVAQKVTFILATLEEKEEVEFEELFTKDYTKSEIITTFQAMLELLKYQYLRVEQDKAFGIIKIYLNPDRDKEAPLGEIDEYN